MIILRFCLEDDTYKNNLERLMEVLFAQRFVLKARRENLIVIDGIIEKVKNFFWTRINQEKFKTDSPVTGLYEKFYRKLVLRDRSLSRPWVFTTNYDYFNEQAMDRLGIPYANGFSGVVERRFNPATFRYALADNLMLPIVNGLLSMPLFISVKYMVQSLGYRIITDFFRLRRFFHQMRQIGKGY